MGSGLWTSFALTHSLRGGLNRSSSRVSSSASAWCGSCEGMWTHLALAHGQLLAAYVHAQRALQHVGHLLALVPVHRHQGAPLQVHLREHQPVAGDDLAGDHLGDLLEGDLVPAVQLRGNQHRNAGVVAIGRAIIHPGPDAIIEATMDTSTTLGSVGGQRAGGSARLRRPDARGAAGSLPLDGPVAEAGRQGDPAQEPEPDLLPDQRRRARGGPRRGGALRCGPATTGSTRTTATARSAWRSASRRTRCCSRRSAPTDDPASRRPADAVALGPQRLQHRLAGQPDRHAVPAGGRLRRGRPLLPAPRPTFPTASRASTPTRSSTCRSARARPPRASSGNRSTRRAASGCRSSTSSRTTATRSPCRWKCRRRAATSRRSSGRSRTCSC